MIIIGKFIKDKPIIYLEKKILGAKKMSEQQLKELKRLQILSEIMQLEKDLVNHEAYLHRNYLSPEGYKKWYARKRSIQGKIKRRKQKCGILMSDKEFSEFYDKLDKENYNGLLPGDVENNWCDDRNPIRKRLTVSQRNILTDLATANHFR